MEGGYQGRVPFRGLAIMGVDELGVAMVMDQVKAPYMGLDEFMGP
jgi:hypothetical protein